MNTGRGFVVPFVGLSTGSHSFKFEIDSSFFESFEYFENVSGNVFVTLGLLKEPNMLIFDFTIDGVFNLICDRCLGEFDQKIEGNNKLIVKFGDSFIEESEDVIIIPVSESQIDLKQYIFEYLSLLLPIKKVHPLNDDGSSGCDPDFLERIDKYSEAKADPRWDALKNLKIK